MKALKIFRIVLFVLSILILGIYIAYMTEIIESTGFSFSSIHLFYAIYLLYIMYIAFYITFSIAMEHLVIARGPISLIETTARSFTFIILGLFFLVRIDFDRIHSPLSDFEGLLIAAMAVETMHYIVLNKKRISLK